MDGARMLLHYMEYNYGEYLEADMCSHRTSFIKRKPVQPRNVEYQDPI